MAVNRVDYGNTTLIDLTSDTVTAEKLLSGYTAHGADGEQITGVAEELHIGTATTTNSSTSNTSISFTVQGEPKMFVLVNTGNITLSSGYYYISSIVYDGSAHNGTYGYYKSGGGSSRYVYANSTYYSHTYSNGTLTVKSSASSRSSAGGAFYNTTYKLVYVY